ncbi:sec-independent protein translocase protein TatA [Kribbella amoyensis]|uniref:Sec-independent protein translocase protein TatA n=1 Tax=Kribbella amoyensis TaxID=996641 RepID=A0A561B8G5_9ACTN|nr:twin-arginine translocase TatA/TatE family subunit [Kribbella amoyensis]TWD75057.1 sec-independent protein translocase protein TatA [Kribbella amoyensis]
MAPLIGMPQGAEWLVILAIVVLLFGSAKLPTLVKQLGRSKKIWEEEVGPGNKKKDAELTEGTSQPSAQQQVQQQPTQQAAQPAAQPNQANGQAPGDGQPPTHTAN